MENDALTQALYRNYQRAGREDFIHVHHLKPLATMRSGYKINPESEEFIEMESRAFTVRKLLVFVVLLVSSTGVLAQESTATRGRRAANAPAAEATVTVNEQFLNSFLTAIFDNLQEPGMPLTIGNAAPTAQCPSEIRLKREVAGVRTAVHFENGRIVGPLAFAGAYSSSYLGCIEFSGWADSEVNLEFNRERRALAARFHLRDIHLNDVPALANGPLLNMVQTAIDGRYNPVDLFTLEQLSTTVNIQPAKGALRLRAQEIRPEITPAGLTLHIMYEFVKG
jgi:hypothetical protein